MRSVPPVPADRPHDVSTLTVEALTRARRDLEVSLALTFHGSPMRVAIVEEMSAIDNELTRRSGWDYSGTEA
jgi:hypothetical protein